jgi:hypothetical protein
MKNFKLAVILLSCFSSHFGFAVDSCTLTYTTEPLQMCFEYNNWYSEDGEDMGRFHCKHVAKPNHISSFFINTPCSLNNVQARCRNLGHSDKLLLYFYKTPSKHSLFSLKNLNAICYSQDGIFESFNSVSSSWIKEDLNEEALSELRRI